MSCMPQRKCALRAAIVKCSESVGTSVSVVEEIVNRVSYNKK
jgi:hypothetical protein